MPQFPESSARMCEAFSGKAERVGEGEQQFLLFQSGTPSDETVSALVSCYRTVFGNGFPVEKHPWNEYLVCSHCKGQESIQKVYGIEDVQFVSDLEKNGIPSLECCGSPLEPVFSPDILRENIRKQFEEAGFFGIAVLNSDAFDNERNPFTGFMWGNWTTPEKAWENYIGHLFERCHSPVGFKEYADGLRVQGVSSDQVVFHIPEQGILPSKKRGRQYMEMMWYYFLHLQKYFPEEFAANVGIAPFQEGNAASKHVKLFGWKAGVVCPESGLVVKTGALDEIIRVWREKFGL